MNSSSMLFEDYYYKWIHMYKEGSVRPITLAKYYLTHREIQRRLHGVRVNELNHYIYQKFINEYAEEHEYLTVKVFHHHCKAAIMDAIEDGLLEHDPTRHLILKGKQPRKKKAKFLNLLDLKRLINQLKLGPEVSYDWMILLIAKTGMRCAEALGLTPEDFDFSNHTVTINKTWDYKSPVGKFQPTINYRLRAYCKRAGIETISIHGLRHTHASLLIYDGVSIPSVAKRLGHANTITTQQTYLHIVKELEVRDNKKILENMIRLS